MAVPARLLNPSDCDLCLHLNEDCSEVNSVAQDGMGYMFGGCRCTLGVKGGRWHYSVRLVSIGQVNVQDTEHLRTSYVARVGVSQLMTPLGRLGEVPLNSKSQAVSIGLNSTGSLVCNSTWEPCAPPPKPNEPFALKPNDLVTLFLDLASNPARVGFAVNGEWLGFVPQPVARPTGRDDALFPHLLIRNCKVRVELSQPLPSTLAALGVGEPGGPYQPWAASIKVPSCSCLAPSPGLSPASECEVIMMVGLPGSGKSTWAHEYAVRMPERRYMVLSPEGVLDAMRVLPLRLPDVRRALGRKRRAAAAVQGSVQGSVQGQEMMDDDQEDEKDQIEQYYALALATWKLLLKRAVSHPRNLILDKAHLTEEERVKRLAPFKSAGFRCRAALAAPMPAYLKMMQDASQAQGAPPVPDLVIAKLMAEFTAPVVGGKEGFTEVMLVHAPPEPPLKRSRSNPGAETLDTPEETPEQQVTRVARQVVSRQRDVAQQWLKALEAPPEPPPTLALGAAAGAGAGGQGDGAGAGAAEEMVAQLLRTNPQLLLQIMAGKMARGQPQQGQIQPQPSQPQPSSPVSHSRGR